jgi:hypothetical protein
MHARHDPAPRAVDRLRGGQRFARRRIAAIGRRLMPSEPAWCRHRDDEQTVAQQQIELHVVVALPVAGA